MRIPLLWYRQLRAIGLTCAEYTTGSKQTKKPQHATEASENISLTKDFPHFLAPQGASQAAYPPVPQTCSALVAAGRDRKSTRLNSSHSSISYALFFFL